MGYYGGLIRLFPIKLQYHIWHEKALDMKLRNDASSSPEDLFIPKSLLVRMHPFGKYNICRLFKTNVHIFSFFLWTRVFKIFRTDISIFREIHEHYHDAIKWRLTKVFESPKTIRESNSSIKTVKHVASSGTQYFVHHCGKYQNKPNFKKQKQKLLYGKDLNLKCF